MCPASDLHTSQSSTSPTGTSGMYNRDGVMVLIDPQSHSYVFSASFGPFSVTATGYFSSEPESIKRAYWDKGPKAIEHFLRHHLEVCANNHVCKRLCLETTKFVTRDDLDVPIPELSSSDDEHALPTPAKLVERARALSLSPQNSRKRARTATSDAPSLRFGTSQVNLQVSCLSSFLS